MNDVVGLIVFILVFKVLGKVIGAIFGGEDRNDFRRDRGESAELCQGVLA